MDIGFVEELSEGVGDRIQFLVKVSNAMGAFFANKNYGVGIESIIIAVICVQPQFDFFCIVRKPRYSPKNKRLSFDVKLDYENFKKGTDAVILELLSRHIINTLDQIRKIKPVKGFDWNLFHKDIEEFFSVREKF